MWRPEEPFRYSGGASLASALKKTMLEICGQHYKRIVDVLFDYVHDREIMYFLFSCLYVLFVVLSQPLCFSENDNVGILRSLEIGLEAPFMSLLLGNVLALCYTYISSLIPWFSIVIYGAHVASLTFFLFAICNINNIRYYVIPFVAPYLVVYSYFIMQSGYNNASIMIGANSLFAFIVYLNWSRCLQKSRVILFGIGFAFCYLIRLSAIEAVLVFSFPVIVFVFISCFRKVRFSHYIFFIIPLISVFLVNNIIDNYYVSNEYEYYREFNKVRGKLHEYPVLAENRSNSEILKINNWSISDYDALMQWFFVDEKKFNAQTLGRILEYPVKRESSVENVHVKLVNFLEQHKKVFPLFFFSLLLVILSNLPLCNILALVLYQFYTIGGMFYMAVFYRFPARIGLPILFLCLLYNLCFIKNECECGRNKAICFPKSYVRNIVVFVCSLILISWSFRWLAIERKIIQDRVRGFEQSIKVINELSKGAGWIVEPAAGINFKYMNPLKAFKDVVSMSSISLGWTIFSPYFYYSLERLGIRDGSQVLPAMFDNEHRFFLIRTLAFKKLIERMYTEDTGTDCHLKKIGSVANGSSIYQLLSGKAPIRPPSRFLLFLPPMLGKYPFPWEKYSTTTKLSLCVVKEGEEYISNLDDPDPLCFEKSDP